jgi:hypothetical protein
MRTDDNSRVSALNSFLLHAANIGIEATTSSMSARAIASPGSASLWLRYLHPAVPHVESRTDGRREWFRPCCYSMNTHRCISGEFRL